MNKEANEHSLSVFLRMSEKPCNQAFSGVETEGSIALFSGLRRKQPGFPESDNALPALTETGKAEWSELP